MTLLYHCGLRKSSYYTRAQRHQLFRGFTGLYQLWGSPQWRLHENPWQPAGQRPIMTVHVGLLSSEGTLHPPVMSLPIRSCLCTLSPDGLFLVNFDLVNFNPLLQGQGLSTRSLLTVQWSLPFLVELEEYGSLPDHWIPTLSVNTACNITSPRCSPWMLTSCKPLCSWLTSTTKVSLT